MLFGAAISIVHGLGAALLPHLQGCGFCLFPLLPFMTHSLIRTHWQFEHIPIQTCSGGTSFETSTIRLSLTSRVQYASLAYDTRILFPHSAVLPIAALLSLLDPPLHFFNQTSAMPTRRARTSFVFRYMQTPSPASPLLSHRCKLPGAGPCTPTGRPDGPISHLIFHSQTKGETHDPSHKGPQTPEKPRTLQLSLRQ
jgi:hypothetical protein